MTVLKRYGKTILLIFALASCLFGAVRGEMQTVLQKAAAVCMECIGIG